MQVWSDVLEQVVTHHGGLVQVGVYFDGLVLIGLVVRPWGKVLVGLGVHPRGLVARPWGLVVHPGGLVLVGVVVHLWGQVLVGLVVHL